MALLVTLAEYPRTLFDAFVAVAGNGAEGFIVQANILQLAALAAVTYHDSGEGWATKV